MIPCTIKEDSSASVATPADSRDTRVSHDESSLDKDHMSSGKIQEMMLSSGALAEEWRMFIVDSGASYNLIMRVCLSKAEMKTIRKAECIALQTANGIIYVDELADVVVHMLYETIMPFYVLDDTVNVVSLTLLVDDYRFDYCQNHGQAPYLQRKGQLKIYCKTSQNVHRIVTSKQIKAIEVALSSTFGAPSDLSLTHY